MARRPVPRTAFPFAFAFVFALALAPIAPAPATASPLEDPAEAGSVFSGLTHANASSIYLNPAALALGGPGLHLYLGGDVRLDSVDIDRNTVDPESGALADGPSTSTTTWSPGGTLAMWLAVLPGDRGRIGLSVHTSSFERYLEGAEGMQYHVMGGYNAQTLLSAAGAYKLADWFVVGLGVSLGYHSLRLEFARDTALEAGSDPDRGVPSECGGQPCGIENPAAAEFYQVSVATGGLGGLFEKENLGLSTGLAVRVRPEWWTTASFVFPPGSLFDLELGGTARVEAAQRDGGDVHSGRAQVTYRTPGSIGLGVRGLVIPGWDLVAAGRWLNLSRHEFYDLRLFGGDFEESGVPNWYPRYRGLRDVWQASAGLEGRESGSLRAGGRVHLETGATSAANVSPLQIEGLSVGAAGGIELHLGDSWVLQGGYDVTWFPTLESTDSDFDPIARIECVDSDHDFERCEAAREGRGTPTAAGSYGRLRHTFNLALRYDRL